MGLSERNKREDNLCIVGEIIEKFDRENRMGFITFIDIEKPRTEFIEGS